MNIILFDDHKRSSFHPLTLTRPVGLLRMGIFTQAESWKQVMSGRVSCLPHPSLKRLFVPNIEEENLFINARLLPSTAYRQDLESLPLNAAVEVGGQLIAVKCNRENAEKWMYDGQAPRENFGQSSTILPLAETKRSGVSPGSPTPLLLEHITDLFTFNAAAIQSDYRLTTHGRISQPIDPTVTVLGDPGLVYIEPGAQVEACYLNTRSGPIYVGEDAVVMEGAVLHGPVVVLDHSTIRAGARIYGATTIGPHCKIAGEVSNSVITGYSNKAHDGFMGNSILGEWCNLGADTNTSNLKNNYSSVRLYNYATGQLEASKLTFCGLIMGDHSKSGINTMFNTGTVVGVSSNVFGGGFPPKFIPSFTWGGNDGISMYDREKAIDTAKKVMARRGLSLGPEMEHLLRRIDDQVVA